MRLSLGDPVTYSVRRQYLDRALDAERGVLRGRVLEIGCGRLGRRGRFRPPADGIDSWILCDRDLARVPHLCADAAQLPVRAGVFDTVVCLEVLLYAWVPQSVLSEVRRVLKPGGTLLLSTPFFHRVEAADDYWRFTEPALRRLMHESGFEVVRCVAQGHALAVGAGVLRHVVSAQGVFLRRVLSIVLRPFVAGLLGSDASSARRHPVLGTFTTGYLVVARPAVTSPA